MPEGRVSRRVKFTERSLKALKPPPRPKQLDYFDDSLPYAFFNIVNPLVALLFGFTGIGVERLPKEGVGMQQAAPAQPGRPTVE